MAYDSMTPTIGTTITAGTTPGMIPGTAGTHPTIATATPAGTTGAGAGTATEDGILPTTTEATMAATTADIGHHIRRQQAATWDIGLQVSADVLLVEGQKAHALAPHARQHLPTHHSEDAVAQGMKVRVSQL